MAIREATPPLVETINITDIVDGDLFQVEMDSDTIPMETRKNINSFVRNKYDVSIDDVSFSRLDYNDFWCWTSKEGKLTKRISKIVKSYSSEPMSEKDISEIGNLARNGLLGGKITFDITSKFDWGIGEFGNPHSCFYGNNDGALPQLERMNALCLRLWNKPSNAKDYHGMGRVWLVPTAHDTYMVFNFYGMKGDEYKTLLKKLTGMNTATIGIYAEGDRNRIYINNERGFLLSPFDVEDTTHSAVDIYTGLNNSSYCNAGKHFARKNTVAGGVCDDHVPTVEQAPPERVPNLMNILRDEAQARVPIGTREERVVPAGGIAEEQLREMTEEMRRNAMNSVAQMNTRGE